MSSKIKSKDLQYDSSLPPFLQRLHDQNAGKIDTDRSEKATARPRKSKEMNDDDEPTIVDESGDVMTKEDLKILERTRETDSTVNSTGETDTSAETIASGAFPAGASTNDTRRADQKPTDGAARKKRKLVKVVGNDESVDEIDVKQSPTTKLAKKCRKKTKPVKLAFDDDDDGS